MTIDEVEVGQRVRLARSHSGGGDPDENGGRVGAVAAVDGTAGWVDVRIEDDPGGVGVVTVRPEELEPAEGRRSGRSGGERRAPRRWWEAVVEAGASIPPDERAQIPRDAAENLDSYLYGWEKKSA